MLPMLCFLMLKGESFKHFDLKWHDYESIKCADSVDKQLWCGTGSWELVCTVVWYE